MLKLIVMKTILRNILAVIVGLVVGGLVNMGIIMLSGYVIPPPVGMNTTSAESIAEHIHLFEPKHFLFPFLAHALGTFVGALVTALMAVTNKLRLALVIGVFFLLGGIEAVRMIPAPMWFNVLDLVAAYIPMAFLGAKLAGAKRV